MLSISGCGSSGTGASVARQASPAAPGSTREAPSPPLAQTPHSPTIGVVTGAELPGGMIASRYTCHGADISPQLSWKGLPGALSGAKEVLVLVRTIVRHHPVITNWAVAGISPAVNYLGAGRLPPGAVVGRNSFGEIGYSLCPPSSGPGEGGLITIAIYGLPEVIPLKPGFSPAVLKGHLEGPGIQWGSVVLFGHAPVKAQGATGG
ncbi:MAG: YbhB/YbcL family Raf kinase inhibitor-like protein [Solirubrobacteraceae bacterium]